MRNGAEEGIHPLSGNSSMAEKRVAMNSLDPSPSFIHTAPHILHGEWD